MTVREGKRAPLSRERVLAEAMVIADTQGLDALTMRNLGTALGVQAMSLYRHVADKDALLDGMVDRVIAEIQLPPPGTPWRAAMRHRALTAHAVLMRHPWSCVLVMSRMNIGPAMLRYVDWTVGCLVEAGFSYAQADHAWNALESYVYGFTMQSLNFPIEADQYRAMATAYLPMLPVATHPHMRRLTEEVAAGRHDGLHDLSFGLELLLDGLERALLG